MDLQLWRGGHLPALGIDPDVGAAARPGERTQSQVDQHRLAHSQIGQRCGSIAPALPDSRGRGQVELLGLAVGLVIRTDAGDRECQLVERQFVDPPQPLPRGRVAEIVLQPQDLGKLLLAVGSC